MTSVSGYTPRTWLVTVTVPPEAGAMVLSRPHPIPIPKRAMRMSIDTTGITPAFTGDTNHPGSQAIFIPTGLKTEVDSAGGAWPFIGQLSPEHQALTSP